MPDASSAPSSHSLSPTRVPARENHRPVERPRLCPSCDQPQLRRRVRQRWERALCTAVAPAAKLRPYQCTHCKHQTWLRVRWSSPLQAMGQHMTLTGTAVGLLALGVIGASKPDLDPSTPQSSIAALHASAAPARLADVLEPSTASARTQLQSATLSIENGRRALVLRDDGTQRDFQTRIEELPRRRYVIELPGHWALAADVPSSMNIKSTRADRINIVPMSEGLRVSIRLRPGAEDLPQIVRMSDGLKIWLD